MYIRLFSYMCISFDIWHISSTGPSWSIHTLRFTYMFSTTQSWVCHTQISCLIFSCIYVSFHIFVSHLTRLCGRFQFIHTDVTFHSYRRHVSPICSPPVSWSLWYVSFHIVWYTYASKCVSYLGLLCKRDRSFLGLLCKRDLCFLGAY